MNFGIYSLIPPLITIVIALLTRLAFEPLLIGCIVGYLMLDWRAFPNNFITGLIKTMQDETLVWVILVCGLYGALIQLIILSGGVFAFGEKVLKYVTNRKSALMTTWVVGILFFIDDYMNALANGAVMRKITDHFKISRELLAYTVSSTAAPITVLVPISTWSIYIGKLMEDAKAAPKGGGFYLFIKTIPFNFYAWIAILLVPLVVLGIIPIIGRMKRAETRAFTTGVLSPPGSEAMAMRVEVVVSPEKSSIWYFLLPLIVLLLATIYFDIDALKGVMCAVSFTILYYSIKKLMPFSRMTEGIFDGIKSMVFALALLVVSYLLKRVGDEMGLTQYVIESIQQSVTKEMLPFLIFTSLGSIAFATGSSWGIYAVAIPMVVSLTNALGANMTLCLGAIISSGIFGAHACFYSDATVLASSGTECNNLEHGLTQLPYAMMAAVGAAILYLVFGYFL